MGQVLECNWAMVSLCGWLRCGIFGVWVFERVMDSELGIGTWLTGVFRMDIAKNNKYQVEEKKLRPFEGMF